MLLNMIFYLPCFAVSLAEASSLDVYPLFDIECAADGSYTYEYDCLEDFVDTLGFAAGSVCGTIRPLARFAPVVSSILSVPFDDRLAFVPVPH